MATIAMSFLRYLTILVFSSITALGLALDCAMSAEVGPAKPEFTLSAQRDADGTLRLTWSITPGNYLYREQIAISGAGGPIAAALPEGQTKDDPNFGPTEVYHRDVVATIGAADLAGAATLTVRFQGCSERGICYPPRIATVDLASLAVTHGATPGGRSGSAITSWNPNTAVAASEPKVAFGLSGNMLAVAMAFFGFGLLLAFTPCVLPMVPILVGLLSRSSGRLSAGRGFALSSTYVLAMAVAYGTLGVAAAWSGQNLQMVLQAPAAIGAMAAVFVALALASFGLFDLRLPSALTDALSSGPGRRSGAFAGAAALGFTSALIVGPCVTPPLAAALLYVAQTGDLFRGAFALFFLGLGMGLPLVAVGTFGTRVLPRSGIWLLMANRLFGVVFLAIAVVLLGRVVPAAVTMALWAALLIGAAVFTGAFDPLTSSDGSGPRLRKTAGLLAALYGAALLIGAAGGADDPLRPLALVGRTEPFGGTAMPATTIRSLPELDAALNAAPGDTRPVLLAFSADWCSACKTMEREVFAEPTVREGLRSVRLVLADVTRTEEATSALMRHFEVIGPPTLVFVDPRDRREIAALRSVGEISVDAFRRLLDRAAT
ncbi:protein-disulfide reductase DsbD [Enterovirga rhinocerotis]|uniref:Thiol:disulfide interchange protein DsbD n=1 Tax=Enterovirga rhinocerotis TaxID=1339210 RepID=A0A4R7BGU8_9HYPH|nr:protein-disulfide reductase DsbD [Enterovirga rhinocerotis]TDR84494.1 thiol:disulfide interchange protein DsbD [Enterovirga rhinocerotis]